VDVRDREHYFALAALAMRRIVVDQARRALAEKRGGHEIRVTLNEGLVQAHVDDADVLALDTALDRLAELDPRLAQVVEWRYFGGMRETEIAAALDVTERTVRRDWRKARAFLYKDMAGVAT
jgi:RNA polymerase sigma factor (TIGR02999 family)